MQISNIEKQVILKNLIYQVNNYSQKPKFYRTTYRNCLTEGFKLFKNIKINYRTNILSMLFLFKNLHKINLLNPDKFPRKKFLKMGNINKIYNQVNSDENYSNNLRLRLLAKK